jgi:transcriptional coactivator HFI1/ADA1
MLEKSCWRLTYLVDWEPEVRKRYAQPLFIESNDFDAESIRARMQPICYEEGIFNGFGRGTPEYMNLATEFFVKNALARMFTSTWSNGRNWIQTESYKRRRLKEEAAVQRGEVRKSQKGLLPVDEELERSRRPLNATDFRSSANLGGMVFGRKTPRSLAVFETLNIDDEDRKPPDRAIGWAGAAERDRKVLSSILDDCLSFV